MRTKSPSFLFASLALACLSCHQRADEQPKKQTAPPPAPVTTVRLTDTALTLERKYLGEVWATAEASLSTAEPGRVRKVHVMEGDKVKRGQLLLELDDRLARVELEQARAQQQQVTVQKEQAEREATRFRELQAQAVTSELESEREQAEALELGAQSEGALATVQARAERVQRHRIDAPFEGTVARRLVDPGDWLNPGVVALKLVTDGRVEILVRVPVELLDGLSGVKSILLRRGKSEVLAELSGTVNALERTTRTALLRLDPEERPSWLRSGSNVDVVFRLEKSGRVVVPRDALVQGVAGVRVIRVKDQKADPVPVEVLETSGTLALVDGNELEVGDHVVVRGNERLRPNQPLAPKPQASSKP